MAGSVAAATPVRGPDTPPTYDPSTDDEGMFESHVYENNCYNYGNDVVTDTFAQPGRGTGHKWQQNTCENMRAAAESDGLTWAGTTLPSGQPAKGHYVALFIWPSTNFHWSVSPSPPTPSPPPGVASGRGAWTR